LAAKRVGCSHVKVSAKEPRPLPISGGGPPPAPKLKPAPDPPCFFAPPLDLGGSSHVGALEDSALLLDMGCDFALEASMAKDMVRADNAEVCAAVSPLPSCVLEAAMALAMAEKKEKKTSFAA